MNHENDRRLVKREWPDLVQRVRERTPARLFEGRAGASYRTATQIELREAHAAARDAIRSELNTEADLGADLVRAWHLFDAYTEARSISPAPQSWTAFLRGVSPGDCRALL